MEYRQDTPEQSGYESEVEEYEHTRAQIQMMMEHSLPSDVSDMLLVIANICDYRALMSHPDEKSAAWYKTVNTLMREGLKILDAVPNGPRPNIKLENLSLYWPDTEVSH